MIPFWYTRGQLHEGRYWIERALWTVTEPGTADADLDEGWELWPPDQLAYAAAVAQARSVSDRGAFERAWQEGQFLAAAEAYELTVRVAQDSGML